MECTIDHSGLESTLSGVHEYQGDVQRHLCAGCAYELGRKDCAEGTFAVGDSFLSLSKSQAQPQRHKDCYIAYCLGYIDEARHLGKLS